MIKKERKPKIAGMDIEFNKLANYLYIIIIIGIISLGFYKSIYIYKRL